MCKLAQHRRGFFLLWQGAGVPGHLTFWLWPEINPCLRGTTSGHLLLPEACWALGAAPPEPEPACFHGHLTGSWSVLPGSSPGSVQTDTLECGAPHLGNRRVGALGETVYLSCQWPNRCLPSTRLCRALLCVPAQWRMGQTSLRRVEAAFSKRAGTRPDPVERRL